MLYFHRFRQDYLIFEGGDRLDLINRLSTNQVNSLQKYHGTRTVLTNDKGRIVDLLTLYNFGDFILAACSNKNSENVSSHLNKYTIMDDFKLKDMTGTHETILVTGKEADRFAKDVFSIDISSFLNNDFGIYKLEDRDSLVGRNDDAFGGFVFICSSKDYDFWTKYIFSDKNSEQFGITELSSGRFQEIRIELGIPAFGNEITELTNPLECGLNKYVSFTKGCYIGQEVIARLDTYDKISKHLVKIEAESNIPESPAKIILDGKECGFITSSYNNKAMGFVKTIFLDYNKKYEIKYNEYLIKCIIKPIS